MPESTLKQMIELKLSEHDMSPHVLGKKAGLAMSAIHKIIHGNVKNPTLETLLAIARVFDCSLDELVGNKIITKTYKENSLLSSDVLWNNELMKKILKMTLDFIEQNELSLNLHETMYFILETYHYCLIKKHGEFDNAFFEWHIQQKLQKKPS